MTKSRTAERIKSAALKILVDQGADAVTMRQVAADAGVTTMASYRHFPNREALLRAVADEAFAALESAWEKREASGDFEARFFGLLEEFLDFALGRPNLYAYLMTDRREGAHRLQDFERRGPVAFRQVVLAVEQGMREGALATDDLLEVTLAITSPTVGLVQFYLGGRIAGTEPEFRALCRRTTERVLHGFRK
ncbi:MAG TPA: TetR/AcrR family transcriptional regulator [Stackebrandtia sp.]|jgi:AcrR family transcriptional regulator|uniref:TetR/AcrR family transcriptional regulator n=1 Tax=Stackebrandtia sp. TaxID=2023065 RepID=UPI002D3C8576|nr:TetR/AcrR family transcriptional regulator [Stackebrandtia sp.]HZE37519.1 TetR/AcrR family transcriptional regulator [Stackebrandtia sp.]